MSLNLQRRLVLQMLASSAAAGLGIGHAANTATTRVLFGFAPGSSMEALYGPLAAELSSRYKPTLPPALTHVPGQSSARALRALLDSPNDGSCVLVMPTSIATLLPQVHTIPDPRTALQAVASIAEFTFVLCVSADMAPEVKDVASYVRWVKERPGRDNYGLPCLGSAPHLLGLQLSQATGTNLRANAYPGTGPMLRELQQGGLPAALVASGSAVPAIRAGTLRALAVCSESRWPGLDQVPTLIEQGVDCAPQTESYAMFLSAQAPTAKAIELAQAVHDSMRTPTVVAQLQSRALVPGQLATTGLAQHLAQESVRWRELIARVGFNAAS